MSTVKTLESAILELKETEKNNKPQNSQPFCLKKFIYFI